MPAVPIRVEMAEGRMNPTYTEALDSESLSYAVEGTTYHRTMKQHRGARVERLCGEEGTRAEPNGMDRSTWKQLAREMMPVAPRLEGLRQTMAPRKRSSCPNSITWSIREHSPDMASCRHAASMTAEHTNRAEQRHPPVRMTCISKSGRQHERERGVLNRCHRFVLGVAEKVEGFTVRGIFLAT